MMIPIFPWSSYDPDDIPDLNPHNKEEFAGCIASVVAWLISTGLFVFAEYEILKFKNAGCFGFNVFAVLQILDIIVYAVLTIFLIKLSFKVADWIMKNKESDEIG